ncbi:FAD-binding domain-containing protein [Scleroderma citrinum]
MPLTLAVLVGAMAYNIAAAIDTSVAWKTCEEIASAVSSESAVYYGGIEYNNDIRHWASSSTQLAVCSFEPAATQDVGIALRIIGENKCPFAVKGGGHTTNPGFSSTTGVQIAMTRFSEVTYDSASQTVIIGAGLIWDDVYSALEPYGVSVVGGSTTGIGVAGFILGGGYSWLSNEHGLAIDNVEAFELVMPSGKVVNVTQSSYQDLFFALKGGFNNFGIVTRFTLKAFPQGQVWGGTITYPVTSTNQVNAATADFAANCTDPKAGILSLYEYAVGVPLVTQVIFYNGPTPPTGLSEKFLSIPFLIEDVGTRSYLSLVRSTLSNLTEGLRGVFNTVSVTGYPVELLQSIADEAAVSPPSASDTKRTRPITFVTQHWGTELVPLTGIFVMYSVQPLLPTIFSHNTTPSAYPGSRDRGVSLLTIYFAWILPSSDEPIQNAIRSTAATLFNKALELGQDIESAPLYPNDAIFDTPLEKMYGNNVPSLRAIKQSVDPDNVMSLAGGVQVLTF